MPIDLICLAVLGYGFWQGFNRGIISTVFNVAAYVFGVVLAFRMTPTTVGILERSFNTDNPGIGLAAFVVNLVFVMFILRMASKSMESAFNAMYLGFFNQVAGGLLAGGVAVMLYSVLLWFAVKASIVNQATLAQSRLYEPYLKGMPAHARALLERLKPLAFDVWDSSMDWMDRLEQYGASETDEQQKIYEVPDDGTGVEDFPESSPARRPASTANDSGIEE